MAILELFSLDKVSLRKFQNNFFTIIIAILSVFVIPTLFILLSPMFICRFFVKHLAPIFRPDLCRMVSYLGSTCINVDPEMHKKPRLAILIRCMLSQHMDFEEAVKIVEKKWILAKDTDGSLLYPEFQQFVITWLGFRFWTRDKKFHIKNHITLVEPIKEKIVFEEDLRQLGETILSKGFPKGQSPWDIHIVPNVRLNPENDSLSTAAFIRTSHSLADGYSLVKAYTKLLDIQESKKVEITYPAMSLKEKIKLPFKIFYTYGEIGMMAIKKFPFKVPEKDKVKDYYIQCASPIPVSIIKDIKSVLGISFTSVVYGILAGAIRTMLLQHGSQIPEYLPSTIPLPKPGHPSRLCNHYICVPMRLPVEESDPIKRLKFVNHQYDQLRFSAFPIATNFLLMITGASMEFIGKRIGQNTLAVLVSTYIPTQWESFTFNGQVGLELFAFSGVQKGSTGGSFTMISSLDEINMTASVDRGILSESNVLSFKNAVKDEVELLKKMCHAHV